MLDGKVRWIRLVFAEVTVVEQHQNASMIVAGDAFHGHLVGRTNVLADLLEAASSERHGLVGGFVID